MRLSNIKLSGFKSFVDATTITFPSNLVGVVGPNGCGKSNVIDAVRWVMGESSASRLRGDSMTDVIFNGSSARKPVGTGSVELIFDNSDGTVGGQYAKFSEISIKRSVARDGISTYFLNGTKCRRKDITGIFLGTGLGPRSYSIIEQGMISRLIEAKPEEMRVFVEEAAGISKYKERRRETETRIRHTRENLERLTDLLEEVEKQIKHLDRQAKSAEKYKTFKSDERRTEAELLSLRLADLDAAAADHERATAQAETDLQAAIASQRKIEASIEERRDQHTESTDEFNEVQGRFYKLGAEIARLEQAIEYGRETRQRQREDLQQASQGAAEILAHIADDKSELEQLELSLSELAPGLEQARSRANKSGESLQASEKAMNEWRERWEAFKQEANEAEQTVQVEKARIEQFEAQRSRLQQQSQRLADDHDASILGRLGTELASLSGEIDARSGSVTQADQKVVEGRAQVERARQRERDLNTSLQAKQGVVQDVAGKLAAAKALQNAARGNSSEALRDWLEGSGLQNAPRLAEQLQVDDGWEAAVELVTGAHLQAIQVADLDQLARQMEALGGGQVEFIQTSQPRAAIPGNTLAAKVSGAPASLQARLGQIRLVDSLAQALQLRSQLNDLETIITRNGEWVGRDTMCVRRADDNAGGVLKREQEIRSLDEALRNGRQESEAFQADLEASRKRLAELEEGLDALQQQAGDAHRQFSEISAQRDSLQYRVAQAEEKLGIFKRESESMSVELRSTADHVATSRQSMEAASAVLAGLDDRRTTLEQQRAELGEELEQVRLQANRDREGAQELAIRYESRKSSKDSASQSLARMQAQLTQFQTREASLKEKLSADEEPMEARKTKLAAELERRVTVEEELGTARRKLENIEAELRQLEQDRMDAEAAVQGQREVADGVRMASQEVKIRREGLLEQFDAERFDRTTLMEELDPEADIASWEDKLAKLVRRIERLGPINLAAIEEFREQSERKEYLDAQLQDLRSALETLENAIRKIDRETRSRFKDTFENINAGFKRLFPKLFGGGQAYMALTGDDLLDAGVTVMAQPPGKRNSTIHLLSGGEKALTAVALVFAIFELNPAPFCMLDEVDAPLDDANVNRFCEIVKEMSETVQFVFITHNKVTMEMARQLSGVTMHEPGVSRLVTVDLDEAIKLAAS